MYILRRHPHRKHTLRSVVLSVLIVGLVVAGVIIGKGYVSTDTTISPTPKAVVKTVTGSNGVPRHFDLPLLSIDLPKDWELYTRPGGVLPLPVYMLQNTAKNKGVQNMAIYLNDMPSTMGLNELLPVAAADDHLALAGDISSNCTDFTPNTTADKQATVPATWQGVNFMCDTANQYRHVVGIGAKSSPINSVHVVAASGPHNVFLVFTDNGPSPDDNILTQAVQSIKVK